MLQNGRRSGYISILNVKNDTSQQTTTITLYVHLLLRVANKFLDTLNKLIIYDYLNHVGFTEFLYVFVNST